MGWFSLSRDATNCFAHVHAHLKTVAATKEVRYDILNHMCKANPKIRLLQYNKNKSRKLEMEN